MSWVTHALIVPMSVSSLVTWCGRRVSYEYDGDDYIAVEPQQVTCQKCKSVMRSTKKQLDLWVPALPD